MLSDNIKSKIYFSKFGLFKPDAIRFYKDLEKQQYLSVDELEALNWGKRKNIVKHAFENVEYYHKKYSQIGFSPEDLKRPEDFLKLPVLTKNEIRDHFKGLISKKAIKNQIRLSTTGGSTGEPLKVYFDKRVSLDAFGWRIRKWWDVLPGCNEAVIARNVNTTKLKKATNDAIWFPTKRVRLDASFLSEKDIKLFFDEFKNIKPKLIWGYAGAIDYVACYKEKMNIELPKVDAVWTTSSPITVVQRKNIESAFGGQVFDQYGCCEVFHLAAECKARNGLHVFCDSRHIEFLNENNNPENNKLANITITDLENYHFPVIRYLNGDMGKALNSKCSCGINLPLMESVHGRQSDLIKLPDGSCLAGDYMTTLFDDFPNAIKGFQFYQFKDFSIELKYVPNIQNINGNKELVQVINNLRIKTQNQISIKTKEVEEIAHNNGKLKYIISEL